MKLGEESELCKLREKMDEEESGKFSPETKPRGSRREHR